MNGSLVLTILSVQSSYLRELEGPLSDELGVPDTIQWWIADIGSWRIKTFGIDHDIHTYMIGDAENLLDLALANDQKHYGDVIQSQHIIKIENSGNYEATSSAFEAVGLAPRIEIADGQFLFWKPDEADYHTQSQPK